MTTARQPHPYSIGIGPGPFAFPYPSALVSTPGPIASVDSGLADLLDSTPYSCCGEELGVFSGKRLYDFSRFKANILQRSIASSVYALSNGLITKDLHSYGFNIETFAALCRESEDILDFTERFADYVTALRGKPGNALVFEKTPQNISCIGEFLDAFKDSYFVYVVRNPLFVYASLLRRNFPPLHRPQHLVDRRRQVRPIQGPRAGNPNQI